MNLSILLLVPLLSAVAVLLSPKPCYARWIAFSGALIQLGLSILLLINYLQERAIGSSGQFLFATTCTWYEALHINFSIGVDGISVAMILLTAFVVIAGVLISWKVAQHQKEFFFLLLLLSVGAYGFFISLDLFTLFFFLELAVIPKFLLIGIWGSGRKEYSAFKLALMLMGGSALVLIGILATYYFSDTGKGVHSFSLQQLSAHRLSTDNQFFIYPFLFAGFGIFTAIFPFHTWAPDGHSSAPTAASMFLAGISMKLGGYGCIRVATYLMPEAAQHYSWIVIVLSTIAIIYGSFATLMQTDLKYMNAYSSVSHCGIILLGIGMLTKTSINGAILQMISHGLMTALFFGAIGIIYDRAHTRKISELGGLLKTLPFAGTVFIIAGLCSLGLPGLSGFMAEATVFVGSWEHTDVFHRTATILACASIVVTAVYILRATASVLMGPIKNPAFETLTDASWSEKLASILLIAAILCIGLAPFWIKNLITPDTQLIMNSLLKGTLTN